MDDTALDHGEHSGPGLRFREALLQGRVTYQRCGSCRAAIFPPRVLCAVCSSDDLRWEESAGAGTVYSASTLTPRDEEPYTVVLVDMEEGFRVMSVVAGERAPLGARVTVSVDVPQDVATEARLLTVLEGASRG